MLEGCKKKVTADFLKSKIRAQERKRGEGVT
jgi:hypothetical protein